MTREEDLAADYERTVYKDFEKQENKNERVSANSLHI